MLRQVTITFTLDTDNYDDPGDNDSVESAKNLVESMFADTADWPWEYDLNGPDGPKITIK